MRYFLLFIALSSSGSLFAAPIPTHCSENEDVHFNCLIKGTNKIASVCGTILSDKKNKLKYIQYRFGHINKVEFNFPATTMAKDQINRFHANGGITADKSLRHRELSFKNGLWNYRLSYFEEEISTNHKTQESAIQVWKSNEREKVKTLTCANPDAGERLHLQLEVETISTRDFKYYESLW